jgi:hypothetical protein
LARRGPILGFIAGAVTVAAGCGSGDSNRGIVVTKIHWNHAAIDVFPRKKPVLVDTAGTFTKRDEKTRLKVTWEGSVAMKARMPLPSAGGAERFSVCVFFLKIDKRHGSVERIFQSHENRLALYAPTIVDFFDKVPAGKHTITIWASAPFHDAPLCDSNAGGFSETIFVEEMPVP